MATMTAESPPKADKLPLTIETVLQLNGHNLTPEERREAVDWVNLQWLHRGMFMLDFDIVTGEPLIGVLRCSEYSGTWLSDGPSHWLGHMPVTTKTVNGWMGQPTELTGRWLRVFKFPPQFIEAAQDSTWVGVFNLGTGRNNYAYFDQHGGNPLIPTAWFYDFNEVLRWIYTYAQHTTRPMFLPTKDQLTQQINEFKKTLKK